MSGASSGIATAPWRRLELPGRAGGALILDEATGLPDTIEFPSSTGLKPIASATSLVLRVGGDEVRSLAGGLDYPGTEELSGPNFVALETAGAGINGDGAQWRVQTELPGLVVAPRLSPRPRASPSSVCFELTRSAAEDRPLRNVELELAFTLDSADWLLHAPGNRVAPRPASLSSTPSSPSRLLRAASVRSVWSPSATAASPPASSCGRSRAVRSAG